jgi:mannitol/fructose-specific phosphotransferase system IIA component (Ntr-type)
MNLDNILTPKSIFWNFTATGKEEALKELSSMAANVLGLEMAPIYSAILYRESLGPTAPGCGLVLPHGKVGLIRTNHLFLARPNQGSKIDFGAPDGLPAQLIALFLTPQKPTDEYIQLLALMGRLWKTPRKVSLLMECQDRQTFYNTFLFLAGSMG